MSMDAIADKMRKSAGGSGFTGSVKFDCGDDGVIVVDGEAVSTGDRDAECTISLSMDDLEAMIAGDIDPTAAFMQGKLKIDGDMSIAMALSRII